MTEREQESLAQYTLPQVLVRNGERLGDRHTAIRQKAYGIWETYTWNDYYEYVKKTALGIKSFGFARGERVAIITDNHPEWLFSELGVQSLGGITVNLFTSAVADELAQTITRIQAAYVVAQDQEQVDKLLDVRHKINTVRKVIYIDKTGMSSYGDNAWLVSYADILARGAELDAENPHRFQEEVDAGRADDIAIMIMTSGTTGIAKLAMFSHSNFAAMARNWLSTLPLDHDTNWLSLSPPPWIVDQMWGMGVALVGGMVMNFPETAETIHADFRELGPSVIITSSRFWEDLASSIRVKISDAGFIKRTFFNAAERIGGLVVDRQSQGRRVPPWLQCMSTLASWTVHRPLLDRIGCAHLASAFTGGHPISPEVIRFFRSVGLNLKQCYGLTESTGIFQVQPDDEVKAETVGKTIGDFHVRLSDEQEVIVAGDNVFRGYYNDFEATEKALDGGWLRTGDAGYFDDDGHLVIIGRKEDIIRNKEGEVFSPDFIETRLKFSPYIKEAVIFGEGRQYITSLINIDMGNVGNWAEERLIPYTTYIDLSQQEPVEKLILGEINGVNEKLPEAMKIRRFILLYKLLDADDEELTRTGKVRRRFVYGLYLKLIEAMYNGNETVDVKTKVKYRDGQTGKIETTVRVIDAAPVTEKIGMRGER